MHRGASWCAPRCWERNLETRNHTPIVSHVSQKKSISSQATLQLPKGRMIEIGYQNQTTTIYRSIAFNCAIQSEGNYNGFRVETIVASAFELLRISLMQSQKLTPRNWHCGMYMHIIWFIWCVQCVQCVMCCVLQHVVTALAKKAKSHARWARQGVVRARKLRVHPWNHSDAVPTRPVCSQPEGLGRYPVERCCSVRGASNC